MHHPLPPPPPKRLAGRSSDCEAGRGRRGRRVGLRVECGSLCAVSGHSNSGGGQRSDSDPKASDCCSACWKTVARANVCPLVLSATRLRACVWRCAVCCASGVVRSLRRRRATRPQRREREREQGERLVSTKPTRRRASQIRRWVGAATASSEQQQSALLTPHTHPPRRCSPPLTHPAEKQNNQTVCSLSAICSPFL